MLRSSAYLSSFINLDGLGYLCYGRCNGYEEEEAGEPIIAIS